MQSRRERRGQDRSELERVLSAARKALARADGWEIEPRHYDRLRRDCEHLGILDEVAITVGLRRALAEISADNLHKRSDESYAGLEPGQTLFEARWESVRFARSMYVKFALTEAGIELFTFHEDDGRRREDP